MGEVGPPAMGMSAPFHKELGFAQALNFLLSYTEENQLSCFRLQVTKKSTNSGLNPRETFLFH